MSLPTPLQARLTLRPPARNRYVAAPDGHRFLFVTVPKRLDTVPFVVVQNWQSALKH